ncbi:hypothetical protein [Streptococcus sciuri]|uniref:Uncharacterized protein n=1 Tax=Streptococcus sciuri TaxID=2973939 RepID=A0ABT2F7B1_9STRE|nr:hypothetical protein [Streptococcus sciuri]MCS4488357.1 hypothetical protein [Streptococcus sciuri]
MITTISDIKTDDNTLKNLNNKSFTTTVNISPKGKKASFKVDLTQLDSKLPSYEFIAIGDNLYMNLDALVQLQNLNQSSQISFESEDFSGKYINTSDISDNKFKFNGYTNVATLSWLKGLSDKDFSNSKDSTMLTLTVKTFSDFLKSMITSNNNSNRDVLSLNSLLSSKSNIRISIDKEGNKTVTATLVFTNSKTLNISSLNAKVTIKKTNYNAPHTPETGSILSTTQLTNLMEAHYKYSQTQFEELYQYVKENASDFTKDQLDTVFAEDKAHMTNEQLQRFNEMIDQATSN